MISYLLRNIDANSNHATEGLYTIENMACSNYYNRTISHQTNTILHKLRNKTMPLQSKILCHGNSQHDVIAGEKEDLDVKLAGYAPNDHVVAAST